MSADLMRLRFKLNHYYQGQNAPFLYAQDAGMFAALGIEMDFIEGFSSSQVTRAIFEGAADIGFGDVTSVIQHAITSGDTGIRCLLPVYGRSPCALGYHRSDPPLSLKDLVGARLCGPQGDTSARLMPALLSRNGLSDLHYDFVTVTPEERDRLVASREVLAATCFDATLKFALPMRGHDSSDIEFLYFADHGLDSYSSAVIYNATALGGRSGLLQGLADVIRRAWSDCMADAEPAVAAVLRRNPGLDASIIRAQVEWVMARQVFLADRPPLVFEPDGDRWSNTVAAARFAVSGMFETSPQDMALAKTICDLGL
jgi:ABC-type nitrate/sulfonate/bicarbonate transport system substrate-binding protein